VYGDVQVPYLTNLYENTLVCYSFSKSLSLPGERIGYVLVSPRATHFSSLYAAVCGAGRALGFVCAPSLFQFLIPSVLGKTADLTVYDTNRRLLYEALTSYGFSAVRPDGAFYLFLRVPNGDAADFCARARAHELLLVPADDFGCAGYVRISYCVDTETVRRSKVYFDWKEASLRDGGDLVIPLQQGEVTEEHFMGDLGLVPLGLLEGRTSDSEITLFESVGLSVQDVAAANLIYRRALDQNLGVWVEI
jgi:hypothetical protein